MPDFGKAAMYVMSFVPCILVSPGESAPCIYERLEAYNGLHRDMESPSKTGGSSRRAVGVGAAEDDTRAFVDMARQLTDWYCPRPGLQNPFGRRPGFPPTSTSRL